MMFEAADPEVFAWYIKHYGPEVNLFVDHSQIVQLESSAAGNLGHCKPLGTRRDVQGGAECRALKRARPTATRRRT